jgi:hypothetical protein
VEISQGRHVSTIGMRGHLAAVQHSENVGTFNMAEEGARVSHQYFDNYNAFSYWRHLSACNFLADVPMKVMPGRDTDLHKLSKP